jgi:hypothetical protein
VDAREMPKGETFTDRNGRTRQQFNEQVERYGYADWYIDQEDNRWAAH